MSGELQREFERKLSELYFKELIMQKDKSASEEDLEKLKKEIEELKANYKKSKSEELKGSNKRC